jgi:hypothetical protein
MQREKKLWHKWQVQRFINQGFWQAVVHEPVRIRIVVPMGLVQVLDKRVLNLGDFGHDGFLKMLEMMA